jgi:hypothetical protein
MSTAEVWRDVLFVIKPRGCMMDQPYCCLLRQEMQKLQLIFVFCFENEYGGTKFSAEWPVAVSIVLSFK